MSRLARLTGPVVLVAAACVWPPVYRSAEAAPSVGLHPPLATVPIAPAVIVGNLSCAAAGCHGGDGGKGAKGSEHATVADADPHRQSFRVLFQERSARMVRNLGGTGPAHRDARCLSCHGAAPPNAAPLPVTDSLHRTASCENCHGAGGNYLTVHYQVGWKELPAAAKAAYGLVPTKDLAIRTAMCAGCHVGEPGREVDHALIAAGHPALRFELAAYQAEPVYTRHWREPPAEAAEWLVGQVATARAAAELLRYRAANATKRDWPELAEFACFSCHQGLTGTPGPLRTNAPPAGRLPWGTWVYPLPLSLTAGPAWAKPPAGDGLTRLAALFRESDRPPPKDAEAAATAAVAHLDRWLADLRTRPAPSPTDLRAALAHAVRFAGDVPRTDSPSADWDRYTQGFLATAALYRATVAADPTARTPAAEATLAEIAAGLRFPSGQDSPRMTRDRLADRWAALTATFPPGVRP